jgi:DNA processing protein
MHDHEATRRWLATPGARRIARGDAEYPAQLAALADGPPELYALGDVGLLRRPQVAIVGSRHPTAAGQRIATQITRDLVAAGLAITSGLARGIDAAAHEAALAAGGATIAICGCGLDICYPREHRRLFDRIAQHGLLLSEFPPGTPPRAPHFPQRNRIISGLSRGVVVVEAAADSGSLITARRAALQGREVFAVPGSPLNPLAAGCLELLREGATLVRGAADILPEIGICIEANAQTDQRVEQPETPRQGSLRLDKDYEMLLDALGFEPSTIDALVERTGLAAGAVASMMLILELEGRVETRPGALYNRID